jgi:hypothetical protein
VSRQLGTVALNAVLGALAGLVCLLLAYGLRPSLSVGLAESPPAPQVSGLYPVEREPSGLTFAWTGETFAIRLPGLDRRRGWRMTMRMRGARSAPAVNPDVTFLVDGLIVLTHTSAAAFEDVVVPLPPRPDRRGVTVTAQCSSTDVPGPSDPRRLGVMVDSIALTPDGVVIPPRRAWIGVLIASAAAGAGLAAVATPFAAAGLAMGAAAGFAALVARGFGAYTEYPDLLAQLVVWMFGVAAAAVIGIQKLRRVSWSASARFVVAFSAVVAALKLALLLHPDMPVGDAMFQAHRFQYVLAGNLFFTSIAPGNYSFPYAPGLYVAALPFADLVTRGAGDMALLRIIVICADAVAAALLYVAVARSSRKHAGVTGEGAGVFAVVLYHLTPLDYRIATVGNLTNAFAQSVAVCAFALLAAPIWSGRVRPAAATGLAIVLTFAFVSHTSTFAVVSAAAVVIATLFLISGNAELRRTGVLAAAAVAVAILAAILLYYSHFMDTYRTEWARISRETASAAPDAGGRGIAQRAASVPRYLYLYYGIPLLVLAGWGLSLMRRWDQLTLAVAGWSVACFAFLVLGVLTPVDMRYYLTAIPALAIAAGGAVAYGWARGGGPQWAVGGLVAWAVGGGIETWWRTFG